MQKSVLVLNLDFDERGFGNRKRIDVWWGGLQQNVNLMILIAHLISQNPGWREDCVINLNMIIKSETGREAAAKNMQEILGKANIEARTNIIASESTDNILPLIIQRESRDADLVILGMALPEEGKEEAFVQRTILFLAGLPTTLLVKSSEEVEL